MTGCIFCQKQDDVRSMKVYNTCTISNGYPCAPCIEYNILEAEIHEMQNALEEKLVKRREIREKINQQHNRMLIHLPREVTTYIFELAASLDNNSLRANVKPLREGEKYKPLFLGSVCRAWRHVVWNMPQLWTYIYIHVPTIKALPFRVYMVENWLARSGEHLPLSIHFHIPEMYDRDILFTAHGFERAIDELMDTFTPLMKIIGLYSKRWQVLSGTAESMFLEIVSHHFQGAPLLRTLRLSLLGLEDRYLFFPAEEVEQELPRPQPSCVVLRNLGPSCVDIDWSRVTSLTLGFAWPEDLEDILPRISNLESLAFDGHHWHRQNNEVGAQTQQTLIRHPKVQFLQLGRCSFAESGRLLDILVLPSLKHFDIDFMNDAVILLKAVSFIRRSFCVLVSMALRDVPNAPAVILELLSSTNSIMRLDILHTSDIGDCHFLQALITRSQTYSSQNQGAPLPPLLPQLQQFGYTLSPHNSRDFRTLIHQIAEPGWTESFPRWRTLSIVHHPWSPVFENPENVFKTNIGPFDRHIERRLVELLDSGVELFLGPLKIAREDVIRKTSKT